MAYLPQNPPLVPDMSVGGLVAKGRTPWRKAFRPLSGADHEAIDKALAATGLSDLRTARLSALSGGQRQRVWLALALAQDTPVILLDEPTAFLDLQHQLSLLRLLRQLADEQGRSIVMVLHELTLAGRFCDHVVGLRDGRLVCAGPAEQAITSQTVAALYDLQADVANDPILASLWSFRANKVWSGGEKTSPDLVSAHRKGRIQPCAKAVVERRITDNVQVVRAAYNLGGRGARRPFAPVHQVQPAAEAVARAEGRHGHIKWCQLVLAEHQRIVDQHPKVCSRLEMSGPSKGRGAVSLPMNRRNCA